MKKIFLTALFAIVCMANAAAQSQLSAEELTFRKGIMNFLSEEGFTPTIDDDDNSVNFKKEGTLYWINVYGTEPTYIEMHESGFDIDDTDRMKLLEACNFGSYDTRCAKAYVTTKSVSFTTEFFVYSVSEFKKVFYDTMRCLNATKTKVKEHYNDN